MTALPVLSVHPTVACAVVNGITTTIGLPGDLFKCEACGGRGHAVWLGGLPIVDCPSCNGSGRVVPEGEHRIILGATREEPEAGRSYGEWFAWHADPAWILANHTNDDFLPILVGQQVCAATARFLPVVERQWIEEGFEGVRRDLIATMPVDHPAFPALHLWLDGQFEDDISSALPFGSWRPGDVGVILTDISTDIECPECEGKGFKRAEPGHLPCCGCGSGLYIGTGRLVFPRSYEAPATPRWEAA